MRLSRLSRPSWSQREHDAVGVVGSVVAAQDEQRVQGAADMIGVALGFGHGFPPAHRPQNAVTGAQA